MSGTVPFGSKTNSVMEIFESILNDEVNLKKVKNKGEKPLIKALLEKDPEKRLKKPLDIRKFSYINDLEF